MAQIINVNMLTKFYGKNENRVKVLNGISFHIEEGDFWAIHGESGSGKSTLLNILAGFEKPDEGEVMIGTTNITHLSESQKAKFRKKNIGFVFQQYHLVPELTALENVMFPLILNKVSARTARKKAQEMLSYVGINKNTDKLPEEYSGGQNQRISIARALISNPKIVFADEPTGNLDSCNSEKIMSLLDGINKDFNTTILMVTHSEKERAYAGKVMEVKDGRILDE